MRPAELKAKGSAIREDEFHRQKSADVYSKTLKKRKKKNTYENTDEMEDEAGWCKHSTLVHLSVMRSTPVQSSSTTAYGVTLGLPG